MLTLPDIGGPGLHLLIVSINPSIHSAEAGHSFASRGNPFWRLLHESGLTPRLLDATEDHLLPEFGLGLACSARRATKTAKELTMAEKREGAAAAATLIHAWAPTYVALCGLTLYPLFAPGAPEPGPGLKTQPLAGARLFALPNPSGLNRAYPSFESKLVWFRQLADLVHGDGAR